MTLSSLIDSHALGAVFQPVAHLSGGSIVGYEGLIRGIAGSDLHTPTQLIAAARREGLQPEFERACQFAVLRRFAELGLAGKVFLNMRPALFRDERNAVAVTEAACRNAGLAPATIVLEVPDDRTADDLAAMHATLLTFRAAGFGIAVDNLADGFSSVALWSELRPDYVKIHRDLIQGMHTDPSRLHMVRAIVSLARCSTARIIAEGVESSHTLRLARDLGIDHAQGFFLAPPQAHPIAALPAGIAALLPASPHGTAEACDPAREGPLVGTLMHAVPTIAPDCPCLEALERFERQSDLAALPVVAEGVVVGLIHRARVLFEMGSVYGRALHGHRPCTTLMDPGPLMVETEATATAAAAKLAESHRDHLTSGFILTRAGRYAGMASATGLLALLAPLSQGGGQYTNPVTRLPGPVLLAQQMDALIEAGHPFVLAVGDVNRFKSFNDRFGRVAGDELLCLAARVLQENSDPALDLVGHEGADTFVLLLRGERWDARVRQALQQFDVRLPELVAPSGGMPGVHLHAAPTLSFGAVCVEPRARAALEVLRAGAEQARRRAKRESGSSLWIGTTRGYGMLADG